LIILEKTRVVNTFLHFCKNIIAFLQNADIMNVKGI